MNNNHPITENLTQEEMGHHPIKIFVWSVQGAESSEFMNVLKEHIRVQQPTILALVETHITGSRAQSVCDRIGFGGCFWVEAQGFRGGIWSCGDLMRIKVHLVERVRLEHSEKSSLGQGTRLKFQEAAVRHLLQTQSDHIPLLIAPTGYALGASRQTKFWTHKWIDGMTLLSQMTSAVSVEQQHLLVNDYWIPGVGWDWNKFSEYLLPALLQRIA
ncbi:hypothetical protein Cgig2_033741 [Carnegiea gigantea]|uniref:Uncharacterized protein n=1 Tax=Carnegiea gigantea TaxID=171969 RepID=A0A9Q1QAZ7_9CARY|nr:hypothetical protein Cgig2_033741 [Carnegiea gigantea]